MIWRQERHHTSGYTDRDVGGCVCVSLLVCECVYVCLTTPGRQLSTSGLGPSLKWLPWFPGEPVEESEELSGLDGTVALTWVSLAVISWGKRETPG